jgi:hypothetical protein
VIGPSISTEGIIVEEVLMSSLGLLNLLFHFMFILAHGYLLVILLWSSCEDSLLFCRSWHVDGV